MNSIVRPAVLISGLFLFAVLALGAWALYAADEPAGEAPAPAPKEEAPAEEAPAQPPKEEAPKPPPPQEPAETPKSPGGTVSLPRTPLLKENTRLVDVEGLILDLKDDLKTSPVSRAIFQPRDGSGYFILLENAMLEKVLAETAHGERPVRVRGTITVFRRHNYLQLDYAAVKQE